MAEDRSKQGGRQVQREGTILGRQIITPKEDRTVQGQPWQEPLVKTPGLSPDEWARCNLGLLHAADVGDAEKAVEWIEKGADPNIRDKLGRTPLMFAVSVKYKTDKADIELPTGQKKKRRVREFRIEPEKSIQCAMALFQHGGDLKAKDKDGKSVLDHASWNPIIRGAVQGMLQLEERMKKE
ncbi:MAG: ankyrin repeat domain-containing protein [Candidatus Micrarchaeota archaeon]